MHVPGGSILIERDLLLVFVLNCKSLAVISQYNVYSSWHASMQINFTAAGSFLSLSSAVECLQLLLYSTISGGFSEVEEEWTTVENQKRQAQLKAQCQLRVIIIVAEGRYFQKKTTL